MVLPFQLDGSLPLSRSTVDRDETLRGDVDSRINRWAQACLLILDEVGRTPLYVNSSAPLAELVDGDVVLATRSAKSISDAPPNDAIFLGEWQNTDYWTLVNPGEPDTSPHAVVASSAWTGCGGSGDDGCLHAQDEVWGSLRSYGAIMDGASAGLFATALSLRNWHQNAHFCARCGGETVMDQLGWLRRCNACGHEEYPRTDPAMICLVHDDAGVNGEYVLLAREFDWPENRFSLLAGFIEAGESLENGVQREIREEVGIDVHDPRYLGSQPWPFPRSIMIGFTATASKSAHLRLAPMEIADARWFPREEIQRALSGKHESLKLPGNASIARDILSAWAAASP